MSLKLRMILLCAGSLFVCGLLGSYKSFQIFSDHSHKAQLAKSYEVSTWVAQSVEQRLQQVESAVSYLDKSTVETLKRFGARYFAYAYKKKGEWIIKWKVLGEAQKEQILSEVNTIDFETVSKDRRSWMTAPNQELIYISPVDLADSHQLKEGFLVFGFNKDFFAFLSRSNGPITLLSRDALALHNELPSRLKSNEKLFSSDQDVIGHTEASLDGEPKLLTSYFSHRAQAWIIRSQPAIAIGFIESRFFTYFLLASILAFLIFLIVSSRFADGEMAFSGLKTRPLSLPKFDFKLPNFTKKQKGMSPSSIETLANGEPQVIQNFADLLDDILADEIDRLDKVGVRVKTIVEEGAKVFGSPQHISDLIRRLIGNSVLALDGEKDKEIQISLVEQKEAWQLIYVDTRTANFPSGEEPSLLLQTEGSLEGIDGIISYASWLFGEGLTVAKKGFCLSVDLPRADVQPVVQGSVGSEDDMQVAPLAPQLERIEILEDDTDNSMMDNFAMASLDELNTSELKPSEPTPTGDNVFEVEAMDLEIDEEDEPKVSFDEVIDQFRMKEFGFHKDVASPETSIDDFKSIDQDLEDPEEDEIKTDDKGLFEFDSGQIKIKIRSPKKRGADADR